MTGGPPWGRGAAAALLLALLVAPPAEARRPDSAFRQGVQAADRGNWTLVETQMRRAIQLDSTESDRRISITGMRYEWYVPFYYLGLAHYRQGDLEAARRAWSRSRSQGITADWPGCDRFMAQWQQVVRRIGPPATVPPSPPSVRPARPSSPVPPPPAPRLTPAQELAAAVSELERRIRKAGPPTTPLLKPLLEATDALAAARRAENMNSPDPAALEKAALAARRAAAQLEAGTRLGARETAKVVDDVRQLVEKLRGSSPAAEDLEDMLIEVEIQLSRNAPDLEVLRRHEAALLRRLHPELGEAP